MLYEIKKFYFECSACNKLQYITHKSNGKIKYSRPDMEFMLEEAGVSYKLNHSWFDQQFDSYFENIYCTNCSAIKDII